MLRNAPISLSTFLRIRLLFETTMVFIHLEFVAMLKKKAQVEVLNTGMALT
ncbi:hypothetical protein HMI55_000002 [Coelomomyces lativittatus]|nr:hypothetical protein HMI55_000002 [Coelomomyces lativittatus]